ncbi:respiratory nitrate reductase subunit beta [Candidatus Brocadia sapporoensis]|uniref:Respiratory nitrate reductase subunit beta n=1 Tax=Candidatus Brocadia sapporoensis TaxID=392547 RepID=A0A1V6M045_9BACT|nr:4Fe-4S dicluster domain-containing protein [Candidatus Brocadia sapporoensis]MDG6006058.1 respiratory nitrate reductase subunit beta [Candidatus Brocadia sp.]OQD45763.1 respiratory nitrate reductase subunit beta [Candidatus Brocadia sapporoensis]GJQ23164.1 MAG: respiratory nitrate reductase subunit [Candidatus Brocadia sapporoensis]
MAIMRQIQMVFDLNKCIGCHTCAMACKTMWTDRDAGQMHMYWMNVETRPGTGYPKDWENLGGWFNADRNTIPLPHIHEGYGTPWEYNYKEVLKTEGGDTPAPKLIPSPDPSEYPYASNWDEDVGKGTFPNSYYFYLPRICNHCTDPACLEACPRQAVYKRSEDGIVLIDPKRCRGYRYCVKGCPYKKVYYNPEEKISQKCVFCYPRIEERKGNFCSTQCAGRISWIGYADDTKSNIYKLINTWKVALRLHPEYKTEPNVFYIPPLSPPTYSFTSKLTDSPRIPIDMLAKMFGDTHDQNYDQRVTRIKQIFDILQNERNKVASGGNSELIDILISRSEADRFQI